MNNLEGRSDSDNLVLVILSGVISAFGITTTLTTLYYFRDQQYQLQTAETSARHLLSMLNFFDLVTCVGTVLFLLHGHVLLFPGEFQVPSWYWFFYLIVMTAVLVSGFITFLLVTTRCINTVWCGYLLDWFALTVAVVLSSVLAAGLQLGPYLFNGSYSVSLSAQFYLLLCIYLGIIVTNCITLSKLDTAQSDKHDLDERRHTTHTVMFLSVLYMCSNLGYLAVLLHSFTGHLFPLPPLVSLPLVYIVLPFKSALNPIIYVSRDKEMWMWMSNKWKKISSKGLVEEEEMEGIMIKRSSRQSVHTGGYGG